MNGAENMSWQLERARHYAHVNETAALAKARRIGAEEERGVWQGVVADKDRRIAELEARLGYVS